MAQKYLGKYRIESARLPHWNYGNDAAYFVTICTHQREKYFGEIKNGKMCVSPIGAIAYILWYEMKHHAKNIGLGEFVVMPNHVHGILILNGNDGCKDVTCNSDVTCNVSTGKNDKNQFMSSKSPSPNTLSSIIRSYKSAVTKYCNRLQLPFAWQTRFHDRVIRDDGSLERNIEYIRNNPVHWQEDEFYHKETFT